MNQRHFSPGEISEAVRDLEAGVGVTEVRRRLGVSGPTLRRWLRKAALQQEPAEPLAQAMRYVEQAANRVASLERRLEAFRLVLITMVEPSELERAARLLEVGLSVTKRSSRLMLGLPPRDPAVDAPEHEEGAEVPPDHAPYPHRRAEEARSP